MIHQKRKLGKYFLTFEVWTKKTKPTTGISFTIRVKHFPEIKFSAGFSSIKYTWLVWNISYRDFYFHVMKTPLNLIRPYIRFYRIKSRNPLKIIRFIGD